MSTRARAVDLAPPSAADGAQLSVSDTGIGVAPGERDHIFDRFWRSRDAVGVGGTGVGLAVVLRLVTAHHGAIDIGSRPGGGTVFTVRLPQEAHRSRSIRA